MSVSEGKNSQFKCRQIKQDEILLTASDVLLSLQVELHRNDTTKDSGGRNVSVTHKFQQG